MKGALCLLLFIFTISCQGPVSSDNGQVVFYTSNSSYLTTDSITVIIDNDMNSDYEIALRCGSFLEMYYQKQENDSWSTELSFSWMFLKCPTFIEKIKGNSSFEFVIPSNEINSKGKYRLILANEDSLVSNSFDVYDIR